VLPLLFPSGRVLPRRWAWVGWLPVVTFVVHLVHLIRMLAAGRYAEPFEADDRMLAVLFGLLFCGVVAWVAPLVVRVRRAGAVERRQITGVIVALVAVPVMGGVLFVDVPELLVGAWGPVVALSSVGLVPVAIVAAILRYRLSGDD